jgi:hypothetical protein
MKSKILLFFAVSASFLKAQTAITPVADGWVTPTFTDTSDYVEVQPSNAEGALVFSEFNSSAYSNVSLEINPYGEPMWDSNLNVYGFSSTTGTFSPGEYGMGTYLGTYTNLSSIGFGQEAFLNITSFVQSNTAPYFGILLQDPNTADIGPDVLSSTRYNYGNPSEIIASPEPSSWMLALIASIVLMSFAIGAPPPIKP